MNSPIAVGQRVDVDESESDHRAAHHGRLTLRPIQKDPQPFEHGRHVCSGRRHIMDDILIAHRFTHEHGRLPKSKLPQGCAPAQDLLLQLRQNISRQRHRPLPQPASHYIGKALHTAHLMALALDAETGPAFAQRQPHRRTHQQIRTELRHEPVHQLMHIKGLRRPDRLRLDHQRAEMAGSRQIVDNPPAGHPLTTAGGCHHPSRPIKGVHIVACKAHGHAQRLAGQPLIQEGGSTRVLPGGLGVHPGLDNVRPDLLEQTCKQPQVRYLVPQVKQQMRDHIRGWASRRRPGFKPTVGRHLRGTTPPHPADDGQVFRPRQLEGLNQPGAPERI